MKEKLIAQGILRPSGSYANKTQGGELISGYECDHMTADAEAAQNLFAGEGLCSKFACLLGND